jgi:hypothetical protein
MAEFDFYLDQKHTIWYRNKFVIEADTLEEAKAQVIQLCNKDTSDLPSEDWDLLHETVEALSVKDNGGEATEELYENNSGDIIWTNKPE